VSKQLLMEALDSDILAAVGCVPNEDVWRKKEIKENTRANLTQRKCGPAAPPPPPRPAAAARAPGRSERARRRAGSTCCARRARATPSSSPRSTASARTRWPTRRPARWCAPAPPPPRGAALPAAPNQGLAWPMPNVHARDALAWPPRRLWLTGRGRARGARRPRWSCGRVGRRAASCGCGPRLTRARGRRAQAREVEQLVGAFDLDPNRVLDLVLGAAAAAGAPGPLLALLRLFAPDARLHVLGFRFQAHAGGGAPPTPPALFRVAAAAVQARGCARPRLAPLLASRL